jgi:DNA-binding beta-propeller fold protein YncE
MDRRVGIGAAVAILGVGMAIGSGGLLPVQAAATPAWTAYVATAQGVWAVDVASDTVTSQITAPDPAEIAITPDGGTAYVDGNAGVTPITVATNRAGTPIALGGPPAGIAIGVQVDVW